ncbi:MAG: hypothetical protein K6E95_03725 [Lachnospiraceae bacterium]|nr:hypothetical protein [Lachnospiraceae bacterium]
MRIEKELARANQKADKDKKEKRRREGDAPEDDVLEYEPHEWHYINEKSKVFSSDMNNGINNAESVFDRYAVFKTKKRKEQ